MSDCIEYAGARHVHHGYGLMRYRGKTQRAHRVAYCQAHGVELSSIAGLEIRHSCDNPPCINPEHLLLGTHTDNMRDMLARGRNRQPKGSRNGRAKLTEEIVRAIRKRLADGESQRFVARSYGVPSSTICRLAAGKLWKHA